MLSSCGTLRFKKLFLCRQEEVPLGDPDILVCSVGTEIFYEANGTQNPIADKKWGNLLDQGWDRELVVRSASKIVGLELQVLPSLHILHTLLDCTGDQLGFSNAC